MRHLKANSQKPTAGRRTIATRNSNESSAKNVQNDRNNIGKRISAVAMPRTRRSAAQANTPSTARTTITSSNQNKIPNNQNGNDLQRKHSEMETLLKKRIPCMTGSDRVANWKSSVETTLVKYQQKDQPAITQKTVQRSSIQERISYDKVSSSTSFGHQSSNGYDFKVPSTMQRNDTVDIIDLTADDASESNTSSITTTQEELYSYLGVVTKSQTSKVETETENKTVKRSSLRVKVKQIALRNQEIYNQLNNSKKLDALTNNTQSLVRYNGHRMEQSSVQAKRDNVDSRQHQSQQYTSKYQQYTQSTYKSTTLLENKSNSQKQRNNTAERNRFNQRQHNSSYQLIPYSFSPPSSVRNATNKCTVMERFVYKLKHDSDTIAIQVNADKYKSSTLASNASMVNRTSNEPQAGPPKTTKIGEISSTRKPDMVPSREGAVRPPQITAGIKRKAMEQWIELSSTHPTTSKSSNKQSNSSNSQSSYTSFQQNTTTTNISTHRKIQKVDVSTVRTHYMQNIDSSNVFQTSSQGKAGTANGSSHRKNNTTDLNRGRLPQSRAIQNVATVNATSLQKNPQQNSGSNKVSSTSVEPNSTQSKSVQNNRSSNALALQTCSQKNIGNNRVSKRRLSNKLNSGVKKAISNQAHFLQDMVTSNVVTPRKMQNVSTNNIQTGKSYPMHYNDTRSSSSLPTSSQKKTSTNSTPPTSRHPNKSTSMPVTQKIAVSNVSTLETSSQQYIRTNGNDVTIEVTVQRNIQNFNSKRASSMQLRAIQNVETGSATSSQKNSQHNIDTKNVSTRGNVQQNDSNKASSLQIMQLRPIQNIVTSNVLSLQSSSQQNIHTNSVPSHKNVNNVESNKTTSMHHQQMIQNILLLPTSSMEIKKAFEPQLFNIQPEILTPPKDLNENVDKDNKPDIPIDLSTSLNNVETVSKRDSKTNSIDEDDEDVKPDLTMTPIVCETSGNISRSLVIPENLIPNFLHKKDGELLSVLSFDEQFVVIQEKLISFWTLPSVLFSIFGVVQQYVCIGKIERYNCDIEIETPYQHRLLVVGNKTSYIEMRAKQLSGTYTRENLMSIYLTVYSFNDQQNLTLRHIEMDRVHGSISSIRYTILPKSLSFVMSWSEVVTNVRKYNLNSSLSNLESVLIFPGTRENLKKLQYFENDKIIAFGYSTITIWDSQTGDITCKIDTNSPIGDNLHFFSLKENTERALFLVQSITNPGDNIQHIKLIAINMNKNYSWKVICTHEMPSNDAKISSTATISNHFITTYENGRSFLLNLYNPRQFVISSSEAKGSKVFVTNDKVITINTNQLLAKTFVDHFFG